MWAISIGTSSVLKKNQVKSTSPEFRVLEIGSDPPIGSDRESRRDWTSLDIIPMRIDENSREQLPQLLKILTI